MAGNVPLLSPEDAQLCRLVAEKIMGWKIETRGYLGHTWGNDEYTWREGDAHLWLPVAAWMPVLDIAQAWMVQQRIAELGKQEPCVERLLDVCGIDRLVIFGDVLDSDDTIGTHDALWRIANATPRQRVLAALRAVDALEADSA